MIIFGLFIIHSPKFFSTHYFTPFRAEKQVFAPHAAPRRKIFPHLFEMRFEFLLFKRCAPARECAGTIKKRTAPPQFLPTAIFQPSLPPRGFEPTIYEYTFLPRVFNSSRLHPLCIQNEYAIFFKVPRFRATAVLKPARKSISFEIGIFGNHVYDQTAVSLFAHP